MNKFFVILKRPLLAVLLFLVFQALAGVFVLLVQMFTGGGNVLDNVSDRMFDARLTGIVTFVFNVLMAISCLVLFRRGIYTQSHYVPSSTSCSRNIVAIFGCVLGTVALNLLSEIITLPNIMEEQMLALCREPWGILAIAVGAPLGEEVMFRWGIMGHMLRKNSSAPVAIWVSAMLFGLMHMNPAQVFFAAAMGIMLGMLYWRSGSIVWPFLLHMLNNSVACLLAWFLGDEARNYSLVDAIGGDKVAWGAIGVLLLLSIAVLWWYAAGRMEQIDEKD